MMEGKIAVVESMRIYENPIPNLVSRHAYFPGLARTPSGDIVALFPIGEAFDSWSNSIYVSRSNDNGRTWVLEGPMYEELELGHIGPCSIKPTLLGNGTLIATGYGFYRKDPEVFMNPETGGFPHGPNIVSFSEDEGRDWSLPAIIPLSRPELIETSGPCIQLKNGELIATGCTFPTWDGTYPSGRIGVVLRSKDNGRSWDDRTLFYKSEKTNINAYETRSCQMPDGRIVTIIWFLDENSGRSLTNHIVVSRDDGITWSEPIDTGITGQASNVISLRDNLLLSIHCYREENTGLYVNLVDFSNDIWRTIAASKIWGKAPARHIVSLKDMGKNLKFGQPSLLPLGNDEFLAVHWAVEDCLGKILAHRIRVNSDRP